MYGNGVKIAMIGVMLPEWFAAVIGREPSSLRIKPVLQPAVFSALPTIATVPWVSGYYFLRNDDRIAVGGRNAFGNDKLPTLQYALCANVA